MKRMTPFSATVFLGAALAAAALPPPSATIRLSSADALFDASAAAGALCADPDVAGQLAGELREALAGLGVVDPARPVTAAVWADFANGGDDARAAAVVSIPVLPGAKDRLADLAIPPEAFADGICSNLPVATGSVRAALADRGDRFLAAVADARAIPAGIPGDPAALLAEAGDAAAPEALAPDALLEIRIGRDALRAMTAASCGDDAVEEIADVLEDAFGIRGAASALGRFFAGSKAKSDAVVSVADDFWFDGKSGLVAATTADLDPASAAAAAAEARPALGPAQMPGDVPPGAVAWFAQSSPDPLAASPRETGELLSAILADAIPGSPSKNAFREALRKHAEAAAAAPGDPGPFSAWVAADGAGRPFFSASLAGTPSAEVRESARGLAEAAAGILPASKMAVGDVEGGWKLSIPLDSAVEAAAREIASLPCGEEADFDAGDIAELRDDAALAPRLFVATNELAWSESGGAVRVQWHAAGAAAPAGSAPDAKAAVALAARAPAGMRPVAAWECIPSLAIQKVLDLYPETKASSEGLAEALRPAAGAAKPIAGLSLAGGGKVAEVTAVPFSELEFFARLLNAGLLGPMSHDFLEAGFAPAPGFDDCRVDASDLFYDDECDYGCDEADDDDCDDDCGEADD